MTRVWHSEDLAYGFGSFLTGAGCSAMLTWVFFGEVNRAEFFTWALPATAAMVFGLCLINRAIRLRKTRGDRLMQEVEATAAALRQPGDDLLDDPRYRAALLRDVARNSKDHMVLPASAEQFMPAGLRRLIEDGWVTIHHSPTKDCIWFELTAAGLLALTTGRTEGASETPPRQ